MFMLALQQTGRTARLLILILAVLLGSPPARAACIDSPDATVRELQDLAAADPHQALARTDALLRDTAARRAAPIDTAWLHAVRAQAFSALELDGDALAAAAAGMKLVPDAREPVHLALVSIAAENVYDAAGLTAAIQSVGEARAAGADVPDGDVCLLITLGTLQIRQARSDLAITILTQAYRTADAAQRVEQRMLAANALSSVMREIGDYKQALELNSEVIEWNEKHHETLMLSVSRFHRGNILAEMHDFEAAVRSFDSARKLSVALGDTQGVAFSDMRICEAQINLGKFAVARASCENALQVFTTAGAVDVVKQSRSLLAQIDLAEGHFARALETLDDILEDGASDMPPRMVAPLFKLRARANAARGNFAPAYTDLDEYMKRYLAADEARRVRQVTGMRARFETDRAIERSAALQSELAQSKRRQVELQRRTWIAIVASILVIALLTAMLIGARRHRRRLSALADLDGLTELPNRRHTAQLATQAIANAAATNKPLTLALIDLDHFKIINDESGHAAGDQVLRDFARLSRDTLREQDIFGRWGGEEFLLLMPGTTLDLALMVVERLRTRALDIQLPATSASRKVSMSAGLASTEASMDSLDSLVALADAALYRAKDDGRNLVRVDVLSMATASSGVRRAFVRGRGA